MEVPFVCRNCRTLLQRPKKLPGLSRPNSHLAPKVVKFSSFGRHKRACGVLLTENQHGTQFRRYNATAVRVPPATLSPAPEPEVPPIVPRVRDVPIDPDYQPSYLTAKRLIMVHTITPMESFQDWKYLEVMLAKPNCDLARFWKEFRLFKSFWEIYSMPSLKLTIAKSKTPKLFLKKILEHRHEIISLPDPDQVLKFYSMLCCDNDTFHADVMFDKIQKQDYRGAIQTTWMRYMGTRGRAERLDLDTFGIFNFVDQSSTNVAPAAYPLTAAIVAYVENCYIHHMIPSYAQYLQEFVTSNNTQLPSRTPYLPRLKTIRQIMSEYKISPETVSRVVKFIQTIQPHEDIEQTSPEVSFLDEIYVAGEEKKLDVLLKLWEQRSSSQHTPQVYTGFISAFSQCHEPRWARKVWDELVKKMQERGKTPDVRTWGALLDGFTKSRDLGLFEATWEKLLKLGIVPDEKCWTMRLQMFFAVHQEQKAKNCLREMQLMGVKMTISIINATISGFDNAFLWKEAAATYQYAVQLGLKPDLVTYNLLLRSFMRRGNVKNATQTIDTMIKEGIRPDIVTYSEFVSGLYGQAERPLPIANLKLILEEMSKSNITPNLHFFTSIINKILRTFADVRAAYEVWELIPDTKWRYSAITCSLLIKHHLQFDEFDHVDALHAAMRKNKTPADAPLFNVTITGYAKAGKRERMLYFLGQMDEQAKFPSISTYTAILECLNDQDQIQIAGRVGRDMMKYYSPERSQRLMDVLQSLVMKGVGPSVNDRTQSEKDFGELCTRIRQAFRSAVHPDKIFKPLLARKAR